MNKKILLNTLLPISVVGLLGGGIASSLALSSCSSSKKVVLTSYMQAIEYLAKNAVILPRGNYEYIEGEDGDEVIETQCATFFNNILPVYNKQSYINGYIANLCYLSENLWDIGGKITIENNKIDVVTNMIRTIADVSKFDSLNKYEMDFTLYFNGSVLNNPYIWDSSESTDIQYAIEKDSDSICWYLTLISEELTSLNFFISPIDASAIKFSLARSNIAIKFYH